jgi:hypothetical protein
MRILIFLKKLRSANFSVLLEVALEKSIRKIFKYSNWLKSFKRPTHLSESYFRLNTIQGYSSEDCFYQIAWPFVINDSRKSEIVSIAKKLFPRNCERTIEKADKICQHKYDLLGSGEVFIGEDINWSKDFKSGFVWNMKFYKRIREINLSDLSDIKVPWELSRFHQGVTLGKAFWYTGDEKYAKEFFSEFESWYEQNPPMYGVNWSSTMDVAIRAINLIWSAQFFRDSELITGEFKNKFVKSMLSHGKYIMSNLEYSKRLINGRYLSVNGNHYVSNLVGLVYLGVMFPFLKVSRKWIKKGATELLKELELQVYGDGVCHELSISYHRLVLEMYLSAFMLLKKAGIGIPEAAMQTVERMIEFVASYTKPDGQCPIIKDADNGRLHVLDDTAEFNDHRYLLCIGAILFERPDFKAQSRKFWEEAFWLLGAESEEKFRSIPEMSFSPRSKAFRDAGYYALRDHDYYMLVTCSDVGMRGFGGHSHNDCLSFELFAGDKAFIVDPGSYVYSSSPKWRNLFRSSAFHNTATLDGKEINRIKEDRLFYLENDAVPFLSNWKSEKQFDFLEVSHNGYNRLEDPVIHKRSITFEKEAKFWIIQDYFYGNANHKIEIFFHFAPKLDLQRIGKHITTCAKGFNIALLLSDDIDSGWELSIVDGWISSSYGIKEKGKVVVFSRTGLLPTTSSVLIYPHSGKCSAEDIEKIVSSKACRAILK